METIIKLLFILSLVGLNVAVLPHILKIKDETASIYANLSLGNIDIALIFSMLYLFHPEMPMAISLLCAAVCTVAVYLTATKIIELA
jgi:hypothetical protein